MIVFDVAELTAFSFILSVLTVVRVVAHLGRVNAAAVKALH